MLAVEGVVGPSTTTTATFPPTPATMTMTTTATAPTVVAGAGVGLLPMVTVAAAAAAAAAAGEPDPRSLLVPVVPTLNGSNLAAATNVAGSVAGPTTTVITSTTTTSNSTANAITNNANPATTTMEQAEEFVKPIIKDGEILLEVECGQNKAAMYLSKLCQGSKGPCINFQGSWLTPNEFQFVSGRETAKDWKRSIRHHGKSLKLLLAKGILAVHPTMCDCEGCRIGAVLTRKGEKRRIPNGERKRKSTGNAPENSATGAFRAVTSLTAVKTQDGPPDPKRPALDKPLEGNQSPLKESSMLNLPPEAKEVSVARQTEVQVQDVSKVTPVESRLTSSVPLMPLASPECTNNIQNVNRLPPALNSPQEHKDNNTSTLPRQPHASVSVSAPVSPSADVMVLSSSSSSSSSGGAAAISALDKSLSRLALYHAASASLKGSGHVGASVPEPPRCVSAPKCDSSPMPQYPTPTHSQDTAGSASVLSMEDSLRQSVPDNQNCDARSPPPALPPPASPQREVKESSPPEEEKAAVAADADAAVPESDEEESEDLRSEDNAPPTIVSHSLVSHVKLCEPNNNNSSSSMSISVSTPVALPASVAALTSPVMASAAPAASSSMPPHRAELDPQAAVKDSYHHKHAEVPSSSAPYSSSSSSSSSSLLPPHNKHSEKEGHITIRHPSPERPPQETDSPVKHHHHHHHHHHQHHSPVKPAKDHAAEKHSRDRKSDSSSAISPEHRDRHGSSKDSSKEIPPSSRHGHERDPDRRRPEERSDRDRKLGGGGGDIVSGSGSKADDVAGTSNNNSSSSSSRRSGPEAAVSGVGGGRVEGIPSTAAVVPHAVPVPAPMADAAAFSEYMRLLAAGHNGFVPPPVGCLPGMFPLRPSADASLGSAAMLHPMQAAAACGMFSSPTALLPKDPVMYPTSAGTLPSVSYGYGAPGMTPLHLLPQQYSTAPSAAMLDYSRSFPYLPWANGLPLVMPPDAAMNAAAVAAAAAAAGSSAKRSREEMESAAMEKRLQLPVHPYGVNPMDYMQAAYRGMATPLSCGLESSMYEKNAELLRKRMYPDLTVAAGSSAKGVADSPYLASLPEYYRALYCCPCMENQPGDIRTWPVEEVVKLVSSLDGCGVYSEIFREQRVNGKILVLLTTESLMKNLGMKLGPALTLTNRVAKLLLDATRTSGCNVCQRLASIAPAVQSAAGYS